MHMCAPECVHVHLSVCMHTADALRSEENIGSPGTDVIGCSEIPDVGGGNQTCVLRKISKCS